MSTVDKTAAAVLNALVSSGILREDISQFVLPGTSDPATPTNPGVGIWGINLAGSKDPISDPSVHPAYLTAFARFAPNGIARVWFDSPLDQPIPDAEFGTPRQWASKGISVSGVVNFQKSVPSTAGFSAHLNSFPTASASGIKYIEIGNEIDSKKYFNGPSQTYAALLAVAYPILKAKGYLVVLGNTTNFNTTNYLNYDAVKYGMLDNCDMIGVHLYTGDAASALAGYDKLIAFAAAHGKGVFCSEVGLHLKNNPGIWPNQIKALITGLKNRKGTWIYFSMNNQNVTEAGPEGLLNSDDTDNVAFTNAWTQALAA